jgi:ankyrin repeat protein/beta-lactamase regulating signal transducer with metallopeptidase domain
MIEQLLSPQLVTAIGWTLIHTLWQGAVFALLLGVFLILLRSYSAHARYLVAVGFLAAFFVAVGLTFVTQYQTSAVHSSVHSDHIDREFASSAHTSSPALDTPSGRRPSTLNSPAAHHGPIAVASAYFSRHLPLIVTLWLMGVLVLQLRVLGQLALVQRLKNYGTSRLPASWAGRLQELEDRLDIRRPVRYLLSDRIKSPFTTGWLRPVILLPRTLIDELKESELSQILAHELAHVKRHDFAVNLLQTVLSTFFFYHPGVWWMSARVQDEREHCCDDLALAATGGRIDYARTLVSLQERDLRHPKLAMAFGGGGFGNRIRRLLTGYLNTATFGEGVVTTLIFVLVGSLAIAARPANQPLDSSELSNGYPANMAPAPPPPVIPAPTGPPVYYPEETAPASAPKEIETMTEEYDLLMRAIYQGEVETVRYLVDKVNDLSRTDDRDFTPLMAAASENEIEIARLLLDRKVDVNQTNRMGWTALIEAADEGSLEVARLLLDAGARVNHRGPNTSRNAVGMAASEGHLSLLRVLIAAGGHYRGENGTVPALHLAAEEGKSHIVRALIEEFAADVNAVGPHGRTALMYAAAEDQPDIVRMLLEAGADAGRLDATGNTSMNYAADEGATESLVEMAERMGEAAVERLMATPQILTGPAGEGDLLTVKAMVEMGMDVNIADEEGNTPLSMAAREGHVFVARYLLDEGARVEGNGEQCSPIFLAAREGHPDMIDLLVDRDAALENGCNYREINFDEIKTVNDYAGSTPLLVAVEENSPSTIRRLLARGADPNSNSSKTSYLLPDQVDWKEVNDLEPADLEQAYTLRYRTRQWRPLLEAVETGEARIVRLLLEAGADPAHRLEDGTTALDLARKLGHADIVKLLNGR